MTCSKGLTFLCIYSTHKELGSLCKYAQLPKYCLENGVNIMHGLI